MKELDNVRNNVAINVDTEIINIGGNVVSNNNNNIYHNFKKNVENNVIKIVWDNVWNNIYFNKINQPILDQVKNSFIKEII